MSFSIYLQNNALAFLLFNLALEKAIRDSGIQRLDTISTNTVQLLGYADDIDIVARSLPALKNAFLALQEASLSMGLVVNVHKTKYMYVGGRSGPSEDSIIIGSNTF